MENYAIYALRLTLHWMSRDGSEWAIYSDQIHHPTLINILINFMLISIPYTELNTEDSRGIARRVGRVRSTIDKNEISTEPMELNNSDLHQAVATRTRDPLDVKWKFGWETRGIFYWLAFVFDYMFSRHFRSARRFYMDFLSHLTNSFPKRLFLFYSWPIQRFTAKVNSDGRLRDIWRSGLLFGDRPQQVFTHMWRDYWTRSVVVFVLDTNYALKKQKQFQIELTATEWRGIRNLQPFSVAKWNYKW